MRRPSRRRSRPVPYRLVPLDRTALGPCLMRRNGANGTIWCHKILAWRVLFVRYRILWTAKAGRTKESGHSEVPASWQKTRREVASTTRGPRFAAYLPGSPHCGGAIGSPAFDRSTIPGALRLRSIALVCQRDHVSDSPLHTRWLAALYPSSHWTQYLVMRLPFHPLALLLRFRLERLWLKGECAP
jgi:hypothetical protein